MGYDRGEVLARTPLAGLCDELLGPHHGRGRTTKWPCPDPGHGPQTGKTPPVTIFQTRSGTERWHCHACGAGGTAIDLMMVTQGLSFRDALESLGRRTGTAEEPWRPHTPRRPAPARPQPLPPAQPVAALERYMTACEHWLWSPRGAPMRRWLADRALNEETLLANRVGADPGPRALGRAAGLPRGGPAVIFPLLDADRRAVYLQARYLRPGGRKYDNPSADLVPTSPRLGDVHLPGSARREGLVVVCEGLPDALTAAQAGYRSVAVLGAGLPDERLAIQLADRHPDVRLVVAFDGDHRGRAGSERLAELLDQAGAGDRVDTLAVPEAYGDLNGWAQAVGNQFPDEFGAVVDQVGSSPPGPMLTNVVINREEDVQTTDPKPDQLRQGSEAAPALAPEAPSLDELIEMLAYQHLLVGGGRAAENLDQIRETLDAWRSDPTAVAIETPGSVGTVLDRIGYHHVLADDPDGARHAIDHIAERIEHWADVALGEPGGVPDPNGATHDRLDLPVALLPETSGPSIEAAGFGL